MYTHQVKYNKPFFATALTEYGWTRTSGRLDIHWEVPSNIEKAKQSLDFVLSGCRCKTGCKTRICSCRKKARNCGPSCYCQFCTNHRHTGTNTSAHTDLLVDELVQQNSEDVYVDDSEDDLSEWQREEMDADDELNTLMHFVFGSDSGTEED